MLHAVLRAVHELVPDLPAIPGFEHALGPQVVDLAVQGMPGQPRPTGSLRPTVYY